MKNLIRQLKIENFKSIKSMELECERINIFVGEPNTGKSNILEALGLFSAPYSKNKQRFLSEFVRYEDLENLFYFQDTSNDVRVISNLGEVLLRAFPQNEKFELLTGPENILEEVKELSPLSSQVDFFKKKSSGQKFLDFPHSYFFMSIEGSLMEEVTSKFVSPVKKYVFKTGESNGQNGFSFLIPPNGENLFNIVEKNPALKRILGTAFKALGLELVLDIKLKKFYIQKKEEETVYLLPFSLVADTFQRYIFHLAAILSNKDSILLLEEPEAHLFPPYIQQIANRIMDSTENQFFIATHSHYLLNSIVEESKEVAVFIVTYEDYETKTKRLSEEELRELLGFGLDIFYNLNSFQNEPQP